MIQGLRTRCAPAPPLATFCHRFAVAHPSFAFTVTKRVSADKLLTPADTRLPCEAHRRCGQKVARGEARAQRVRNPWIAAACRNQPRKGRHSAYYVAPAGLDSSAFKGSRGYTLAALVLHPWLPAVTASRLRTLCS